MKKTGNISRLYYPPQYLLTYHGVSLLMQKQQAGPKITATGTTTIPTEIPLLIHGKNPGMTGTT